MVFTACAVDQPHLYVESSAHYAANNMIHAQQSFMIRILTQMATLTKHAESVLSALIEESTLTNDRINVLATRIQNAFVMEEEAEEYVQTLSVEKLLEQNRASYIAAPNEAAQLFTTSTRPIPLQSVYAQARPPPQFEKVQQHMDEGQDAMKLYSNPGFFLDTWIEEQQRLREEAKRQRRERKKQRQEKRDNKSQGSDLGSVTIRKIQVVKYDPMTGEKIFTEGRTVKTESSTLRNSTLRKLNSRIDLPSGQAPPPVQIVNEPSGSYSQGTFRGVFPVPAPSVSIPPPVPPMVASNPYMPPLQRTVPAPRVLTPAPPPPPVPPPPPGMGAPAGPPRILELGAALANAHLQRVEVKPKPVDARSNLLEGIKKGVALKSAQERTIPEQQQEEASKAAMSVAAILSRRIAVAGSDSDDSADEEDQWD